MERPRPPESLFAAEAPAFVADQLCEAWIRFTFIDPAGPLFNGEHEHLQSASIGVLWTTAENSRHMNSVVGQAEMPHFQGNRWIKGRQEQQMVEWFGCLPDFVLTFDARYAAECADTTWCALVEHELCHCGQARNEYGGPKFRRDGRPVFGIRGHDVEEFVSIVRRYGVGAAAGGTAQLVAAAALEPEISAALVAGCCGTCRLNF